MSKMIALLIPCFALADPVGWFCANIRFLKKQLAYLRERNLVLPINNRHDNALGNAYIFMRLVNYQINMFRDLDFKDPS